ncbi:MAG TPA: hypothetical protein VGL66_15330 [Caulobacteraceae bacterium]
MSNLRLYADPAFLNRATAFQAIAACGLRPAPASRLGEARALAEARIGAGVAPLAALHRLRRLAPASILIFEERSGLTGVLGVLPLTAAGARALLAGALDLSAPRRDDIAPGFETADALYAMGIASATRDAARAVVSGVVRLRQAHAAIPFYARPVTGDGRRVLIERLRCVPMESGPLMVSPAVEMLGAAA